MKLTFSAPVPMRITIGEALFFHADVFFDSLCVDIFDSFAGVLELFHYFFTIQFHFFFLF